MLAMPAGMPAGFPAGMPAGFPAGIPAGMVADAPVLRLPCLGAPQPEPVVRRQPRVIEYPPEGGLYDTTAYERPPHESFFRYRYPVLAPPQHPAMPPRANEHYHMPLRANEHHRYMQHKVHKSYLEHQRHRSGSGSPPRTDPLVAHHLTHIHGNAHRPPRMQNINTPSQYASAPSLAKPDFSLQAHEALLRQAAMRAALHNGNRQTRPVELPVRRPLPSGRPGDLPKEKLFYIPRQTRRMLSEREKMDICLFHENHRSLTHKDIADKFGVERTTVTKILMSKQQRLYSQQN